MPVRIIEFSERKRVAEHSTAKRYVTTTRRIKDAPPLAPFVNVEPRNDAQIFLDDTRRIMEHLLPRYHITIRKEHMPVRLIKEEQRQPRATRSGIIASSQEVTEALEHSKKLAPGMAIEITLDDSRVADMKKDYKGDAKKFNPARAIANMLKRKFETLGVAFDAYPSDTKTVTVVRGNRAKKSTTKKK